MAYTKGPWDWRGRGGQIWRRDENGKLAELVMCTTYEYDSGSDVEISEANAALILASPDLLEFVQQIFNGIDTGMITIDTPADETLANVLSRGRAALSKATGAA